MREAVRTKLTARSNPVCEAPMRPLTSITWSGDGRSTSL